MEEQETEQQSSAGWRTRGGWYSEHNLLGWDVRTESWDQPYARWKLKRSIFIQTMRAISALRGNGNTTLFNGSRL